MGAKHAAHLWSKISTPKLAQERVDSCSKPSQPVLLQLFHLGEEEEKNWGPGLTVSFTGQGEEIGQHEDRLRRFAAAVYPLLCQLWCADLRPEVCSVLRSLFLRVGAVYGISNLTNGVHHHGEEENVAS